MLKRAVLLGFCLVSSAAYADTPEGPCDKKGMASLRDALGRIDPAQHGALVAQGVGEACEKRLPPSIAKVMLEMNQVDPQRRTLIVAKGLAGAIEFSRAACAKFPSAFAATAEVAPKDKMRVMYTTCDYGKLGLVTEAELTAAGERSLALAFLAPPLYRWLTDNGMSREPARKLMRTMLGL